MSFPKKDVFFIRDTGSKIWFGQKKRVRNLTLTFNGECRTRTYGGKPEGFTVPCNCRYANSPEIKLLVGFGPTTPRLQITCSTSWAKAAFLLFVVCRTWCYNILFIKKCQHLKLKKIKKNHFFSKNFKYLFLITFFHEYSFSTVMAAVLIILLINFGLYIFIATTSESFEISENKVILFCYF